MAKVSLRIYNKEIEGLVDRGQLDEAIAHCRHILNAFPKNLETYRLLGKAYLEAKRYGEATDILERVLMAVPDDFVAHVGMSIVNDEQKNMDAAIWHMERAFEVQPSNAAIQSELQRLYGRRDGIEPAKIRLTRGALAHMYVQGELYPQAISEITSVLEEDAGRQDMQVLLARAYFHAGQKGEAAEMCSQLLRRYPYNLDANRVLVELLPQTEHGESIQVYRHRINELDPYAAFTTGSVFHTEEVSDVAVGLERLEWDGQPIDMQPEWSDGLGIHKDDSTPASSNEEPDWLKAGMMNGTSFGSTQDEEPASDSGSFPIPTANGDEDIPDFMRAAGWGEDTGTFQEGLGAFDELGESGEDTIEGLAEGDMPDWVKAMAPEGSELESAPLQASSLSDDDLTQDDVPDWLQGLGDGQESEPAEQQSRAVEGDIPDWLTAAKSQDESELQELAETASASDEGVPDWLGSVQSSEEGVPDWLEPLPSNEEDAPDWLDSLQSGQQAVPEVAPQEPVQESTPETLSDWQVSDEFGSTPVSTNGVGMSTEEQDDAVAWLEGLASKHGAKPEEMVTDPESRKETAPDWVQESQADQEQPEPEGFTPAEEEPVSEEPFHHVAEAAALAGAAALGVSAEEQDDAVAWLEGLASKHGANPEEMVTDPEARKETAPDWVQESQVDQEQPEPDGLAPMEEEPEAEEPFHHVVEAAALAGAVAIGASAEEQDEAVAWLEGLASKHGAKPEEMVTDPESRKETAPDWVQESQADQEQPESEAFTPPVDEPVEDVVAPISKGMSIDEQDDAVAWLEGLASEQSAKPEELVTGPDSRKEDAPDWVQESQADQESAEPEQSALQEEAPQAEEPSHLLAKAAALAGVVGMGASAEEQDEAVAWLEGLASKHGAKPEEMVTDPDTRKETAPDWVQKASETVAEEPAVEEPARVDETPESEPDWMKHAKEVGESLYSELEDSQTKEPLPTEDADESGMWLRDLGQDAGFADDTSEEPAAEENISDWLAGLETDESVVKTAPEAEADPEPVPDAESDTPAWLRDLESESSAPGSIDEKTVEEAGDNDLPSWLSGLEDDAAQEKPAEPDDGMPKWLGAEADDEPFPSEPEIEPEPEPTAPTDWKPVESIEPSPVEEVPISEPEITPEPLPQASIQPESEPQPKQPEPAPEPAVPAGRSAYQEPVTRSRSGMTGMLSPAEEPLLVDAQTELTRSNIPAAMESYGKLIKKGKMLEEVIFDLREALYRYPVEVSIMQTLGDAYMRANRLQDALDAYTQAEELLR